MCDPLTKRILSPRCWAVMSRLVRASKVQAPLALPHWQPRAPWIGVLVLQFQYAIIHRGVSRCVTSDRVRMSAAMFGGIHGIQNDQPCVIDPAIRIFERLCEFRA